MHKLIKKLDAPSWVLLKETELDDCLNILMIVSRMHFYLDKYLVILQNILHLKRRRR